MGLMIDTYSRDPKRALQDVNEVLGEAQEQGMRPIEWRLGFFVTRDLIASIDSVWQRRRRTTHAWVPVTHLYHVPAHVVMMEDWVELIAGCEDDEGKMILQSFVRDRRSGVD
jgi:hypothetical protein